MPDFNDIAVEYDRIKQEDEVLDQNRVKENKVKGKAADDLAKRQSVLPDERTHAKLEEKLSTMFDKSSRAGAKSNAPGLILPNGRKNFTDFHENYTGTGRIEKKQDNQGFVPQANAPKVDTPQASVVLYEQCVDCFERVEVGSVIPDMDFVPPRNRFVDEIDKWAAVGLKPGMIVCSLFCTTCATKFATEHRRILNDPFKNSMMVMGPDGRPTSLAAVEAEQLKHTHRQKTRENIIYLIKQERRNPLSQCFYGDAVIGN